MSELAVVALILRVLVNSVAGEQRGLATFQIGAAVVRHLCLTAVFPWAAV